jgi:ribonuclease HII
VGRGPLIGDVVSAAVILPQDYHLQGLNDSKKLSKIKRESFFEILTKDAIAWSLGRASVAEIDKLNILQASLLSMHRAVATLVPQPDFVYVDGNHIPFWPYASEAIIKGDCKIQAISAASIIAKVARDREMQRMDQIYPGYGLADHKGYPSKVHLQALKKLGPCPLHRRSFRPVSLARPLNRLTHID